MKTKLGLALLTFGWTVYLGLMCYAYLLGHAHEEARPVAAITVMTACIVPQIAGWILLAKGD